MFPRSKLDQLRSAQEIKASAELLLELACKPDFTFDNDGNLVVERLTDLGRYAELLSMEQAYHPLIELKNYFTETPIFLRDADEKNHKMTLEKALSSLNGCVDQRVPSPLLNAIINHVREEVKHGGPLYLQLKELCRHQ